MWILEEVENGGKKLGPCPRVELWDLSPSTLFYSAPWLRPKVCSILGPTLRCCPSTDPEWQGNRAGHFFVNLTSSSITCKDGASIEGLDLSDWPVGVSEGQFLDEGSMWEGPFQDGWCHNLQAEQGMANKPVVSLHASGSLP